MEVCTLEGTRVVLTAALSFDPGGGLLTKPKT